jgi:hypothetical protein
MPVSRVGLRDAKSKTPVTEKYAWKRFHRISGRRERIVKNSVPEDQLKQYGDILEEFNINRGQSRNQPI